MQQDTVILERAYMLRGITEWYNTCLASARLPGFDTAQNKIITMLMAIRIPTGCEYKTYSEKNCME